MNRLCSAWLLMLSLGLCPVGASAQGTSIQMGVGPVFGLFAVGLQTEFELDGADGWTLIASVPVLWPSERDPVAGYQDRGELWGIPQVGTGWRTPVWNSLSAATELSTGFELGWLDESVVDPAFGIQGHYTHAAVSWKSELRLRLDWLALPPWGVEVCLSFNLASINRSRGSILAIFRQDAPLD